MSRKLQRQQAQEIYIARMNELARSRYALPVERRTIGFTKFAAWFEAHHLPHRKGKARELEILARLKAYFGDKDLTSISRHAAQEYITERLAQTVPHTTRMIAPSTVNREVDVLKAVLREAVPKYLAVSPLVGMKRLRSVQKQKGRTITPVEERRLLEQLAPADRALYIVAVDTLIRLSNVINLKWVDVRKGWLALEDSKTGPYDAVLSKRAAEALAKLPRSGVYCFPHRRVAEKPRDQRGAIRKMLANACRRCKPPIPYGRASGGITWHTATRATGATRLLRDGTDLRTVQEIGNWEDLRSVQAYLEPNRKQRKKAVDRIGKAV
jgi:integrase